VVGPPWPHRRVRTPRASRRASPNSIVVLGTSSLLPRVLLHLYTLTQLVGECGRGHHLASVVAGRTDVGRAGAIRRRLATMTQRVDRTAGGSTITWAAG
jgi:hypothetical protein